MASWSELRTELIRITGLKNVYYQPPANVRMSYPCIRFKLEGSDVKYASNGPYRTIKKYQIIYITNKVDDDIIRLLPENLRYCIFDRLYSSDNLYHYVFEIYY